MATKKEIVDQVSEAAGLTKKSAAIAVDAVIDSITASLVNGESVAIPGFGTFSVRHRAARTGRNPKTKQTIQIAASSTPGFKAGKTLKDAVNK